jgi:hypothetical protein
MISVIKQKSDLIGAIASFTCMVHCLATPFLFIASACSKSCCAAAPTWWVWLDFVFLFISFFAVLKSTKHSSKSWMKPALWTAWTALSVSVFMEQFDFIYFSEYYKYTAAFSLIGLHLYNLKYCQCKSEKCCAVE